MITSDHHRHYTFADFMKLPEGTLVQLIGGELVREPAPTSYHQLISSALHDELGPYVRKHKLGVVIASPIDVYFSNVDAYQPDVIFIAAEHREIIGEKYITSAPDMVVEILSPSTASNDLTRKKEVYERSGVREYWIIDPRKKSVDCFTSIEGKFDLAAHVEIDGVVRSTVIEGFEVEARTIFDVL
jgi:Uma2 family endonuclease